MTFDNSILRVAWATLSAPVGDQLSSYPLAVAFDGHPVRVALDKEAHRHLLVPAGNEKVQSDERRTVLTLTQRDLVFGADSGSFVDIRCGEGELNAEFDDFIEDVITSIEGSETPAQETVQVIGRWRRMFRSASARGLSEIERLGLFAELTVLSALHSKDAAIGAVHWTGPDREKHDFELPARCLEVKALGEGSDGVTIHGLEQLDTHDDRELSLVMVTVVVDDDGITLAELVDQVQSGLGSDPQFPHQLAKAKWDKQDHMSQIQRYSVAALAVVPVTPATPRLVPSSLTAGVAPNGVSDVQYHVSLDELLPLVSATSAEQMAEAATA